MKCLFVLLLIAFVAESTLAQTTQECPEWQYLPHYINPNPVIQDTVITNPPENDPPPPPESGEKRGIFWVHGLGGDVYGWNRANSATRLGASGFPARDVITATKGMTYGVNSLIDAGLNLEESIFYSRAGFEAAGVTDHLQNYVIAHSQGGLVSRMADKQYDILDSRTFGGIVTFGTPHGGAQIINSRNSGYIEQFAAEGCKALGSAELLEVLGQNVSPFIFNVVSNGGLQLVNGACDLGSALLPHTLFSEMNTPITNDYLVGAEELGNLNAHGNPNVQKVAMHGVEYAEGEEPINPKQLMFRTFSSRSPNTPLPFEADDDDEMVEMANQETARYLEKYHYYKNRANRFRWGFLLGIGGIAYNHVKAKRDLKLAEVFWDAYGFMQRADDRWKFIIGAKQWSPNAPDACMCEWINTLDGWSHFGPNTFVNTPEDCDLFAANYNIPGEYVSCSWAPGSFVLEAKASDGVVLQESASAFPGATTHYMDKTNHFQMRNSSKTKEALFKLYEGILDPWFVTNEK